MGAEATLSEMGLTVPEVVPPLAAYQPTARSGNLVFTAGQLPARDGEMIALRTGAPLHPQRLVEQAEAVEMTPDQRSLGRAMSGRWIVGSAEQARTRIEELASTYGVDEVMVHPVAGATTGTDATTSPNRETTLRLLAG